MRIPLSWLREYVDVPADETPERIGERLVAVGLELEEIVTVGGEVTGPLVIGRVLEVEELTEFKKPIRFCRVEVGPEHGHPDTPGVRGIVCGARNFVAGDVVVVALPGAVLPGDFRIASRETYGKVSDGMICSERELGLGDDHNGIMVLPEGTAEIGDDAGPVIGLGDVVLDVAVTPDMGFCLSMRGVARELAHQYGVPLRDPAEIDDLPAPDAGTPHECAIDDLDGCSLFTLRTIVGFDPTAPSPYWMRRRLVMSGMRPVSLAVDVTNYVMLETGQPLHAFDQRKLQGAIVVRRARAGEKLETLDHVVRTLSADDLLITDDRGPIGLAGTMGGLDTEIDDDTVDIALEAAHFTPAVVARMSRRHKLSSEASRRFERGVDTVLAPYASARAAGLLLAHGGGRYVGMTGVEAPREPVTVEMAADLPARVAGIDVPRAVVVERLEAVGATVADPDADVLVVTAPTWRPDITDPADLVEEVLRLGGYDAIPPTLPQARAGYGLTESQRARRRVGRALAAAGYVEALAYPFVGDADLDALGIPADDERRRLLLLANPLSDEQPGMRTTLLPGLVATLRRNVGRGTSDVALFEAGSVFHLREGQQPRGVTAPPRPSVAGRPSHDDLTALTGLLPEQPLHVGVVLAGNVAPAGWWGGAQPAVWADAVEAARTVAGAVGADLQVRKGAAPAPWHPGRVAELVVAGAVVGFAGELAPRVCEDAGLPKRTSAMELDLDAVIAAATPVVTATGVLTFPVAKEDVALVVASDVAVSDVEAALVSGAGPLLESVRLFDVYTGEQVGEGSKSLAFALRFRAPDRTLTVEEVGAARDSAVAAAAAAHGAVQRA
ncbi:phenylalanine--tRNA ligase subunit beta [Longivirga aurantiaca]|uniref:Phenylalanine--tRNA ligase beta subunit n=1 Tax=Longivirga aurantiaca TaxID=1837743 RepID=A0ABW1T1N6_9ACTN